MQEKQEMQEKAAVRPQDVEAVHLALEASLTLIGLSFAVNSAVTEYERLGVTVNGQMAGDWTITVQRTDVPAEDREVLKGEAEQMALALPAAAPPLGPGHGDS